MFSKVDSNQGSCTFKGSLRKSPADDPSLELLHGQALYGAVDLDLDHASPAQTWAHIALGES